MKTEGPLQDCSYELPGRDALQPVLHRNVVIAISICFFRVMLLIPNGMPANEVTQIFIQVVHLVVIIDK